jgi:hypothetical protein
MRQWHNYTIIWRPENATFQVDGETVFTTRQVPNVPLSVGVLMQSRRDNLLPGGIIERKDEAFFPLEEDQWIKIDHIHVYMVQDEFDEYTSKANQSLRDALKTINSAKLGGIETDGLEEDHAQAQLALTQTGYIPGELYVRTVSIAEILPGYLDELSELFTLAEEKIESDSLMGKDTRHLEAQIDRALKAVREADYTLAIDYLEIITGDETG